MQSTVLTSLGSAYSAAVFGATGGLGKALVDALSADANCAQIWAASRSDPVAAVPKVRSVRFDLLDEASIAAAVNTLCAEAPPQLCIVATGLLHDNSLQPEKTLRSLDAAALQRAFQINTLGPALIGKYLLPLLPRDRRSVFGVLSARVSSISDNRRGGWHAYRASKAALNMVMRNFAIELANRNPQVVCVGLHPGTVDTALSKPFQAGVAAGQLFTPATSAAHLLKVIDAVTPADSGCLLAWDGQRIAY